MTIHRYHLRGKAQTGFTVLELLVVIFIIGVFSTFVTLRLGDSALQARDTERASDINALSGYLEQWQRGPGQGAYPVTTQLANNNAWLTANFPGIDTNIASSPLSSGANSIVAATNATVSTSGVTPLPTTSQYVYQPLKNDGTLCSLVADTCTVYYLYYRTEVGSVVTIKKSGQR